MTRPLNRPTRPTLKVINGNPAAAKRPRRPRPDDGHPFILPAIEPLKMFPSALAYKAMGVSRGQANLAFQAVMSARDEGEVPRYVECIDRLLAAKRELALALEDIRRETLAILMEHYPAAARRIMRAADKGRAPK